MRHCVVSLGVVSSGFQGMRLAADKQDFKLNAMNCHIWTKIHSFDNYCFGKYFCEIAEMFFWTAKKNKQWLAFHKSPPEGRRGGEPAVTSISSKESSKTPNYLTLWPLIKIQHLISLYNISPKFYIKVTRMKEMITNWRSSWFWNKFSWSEPYMLEIYRGQYGEYALWC